jgi:hypothetical protein
LKNETALDSTNGDANLGWQFRLFLKYERLSLIEREEPEVRTECEDLENKLYACRHATKFESRLQRSVHLRRLVIL